MHSQELFDLHVRAPLVRFDSIDRVDDRSRTRYLGTVPVDLPVDTAAGRQAASRSRTCGKWLTAPSLTPPGIDVYTPERACLAMNAMIHF